MPKDVLNLDIEESPKNFLLRNTGHYEPYTFKEMEDGIVHFIEKHLKIKENIKNTGIKLKTEFVENIKNLFEKTIITGVFEIDLNLVIDLEIPLLLDTESLDFQFTRCVRKGYHNWDIEQKEGSKWISIVNFPKNDSIETDTIRNSIKNIATNPSKVEINLIIQSIKPKIKTDLLLIYDKRSGIDADSKITRISLRKEPDLVIKNYTMIVFPEPRVNFYPLENEFFNDIPNFLINNEMKRCKHCKKTITGTHVGDSDNEGVVSYYHLECFNIGR